MTNMLDITSVEEEVSALVRALGISDRVYMNRPKAAEQSQDFIVVRCGTVRNMGTYGECTVSVDLFAKDIGSLKNSKKLSVMYRKLAEGLPAASGALLFDTAPNVIGDTPDDYGFHARTINIQTTIKTQ